MSSAMMMERTGMAMSGMSIPGLGTSTAGTPTGMHTMDPQTALRRAEQGMRFIAIGSELLLLTKAAQDVVKQLRPEKAEKDLARY